MPIAAKQLIAAGAFWTNYILGIPMLKRIDHRIQGIIDGHHEASHVRIGDGQGFARQDLTDEKGNDRPPGAHDIAVAGAAEDRPRIPMGPHLAIMSFSISALDIPIALIG